MRAPFIVGATVFRITHLATACTLTRPLQNQTWAARCNHPQQPSEELCVRRNDSHARNFLACTGALAADEVRSAGATDSIGADLAQGQACHRPVRSGHELTGTVRKSMRVWCSALLRKGILRRGRPADAVDAVSEDKGPADRCSARSLVIIVCMRVTSAKAVLKSGGSRATPGSGRCRAVTAPEDSETRPDPEIEAALLPPRGLPGERCGRKKRP